MLCRLNRGELRQTVEWRDQVEGTTRGIRDIRELYLPLYLRDSLDDGPPLTLAFPLPSFLFGPHFKSFRPAHPADRAMTHLS